jgi:Xaa-Pro aminopeptidase
LVLRRGAEALVKGRLERLRELMRREGFDAYLVPGTDPHQSEYVPARWGRRSWISGFTGSAGDVVVTLGEAGLWTDSRYFIQAEQQLATSGIDLFKKGTPGVPDMEFWLGQKLKRGHTVGADSRLLSVRQAGKLQASLQEKGIGVSWRESNLIDVLWVDRPERPGNAIKDHPVIYAGRTREAKLRDMKRWLREKAASVHVLSQLDSIAWILNLRGSDVAFNPVAIAYLIISRRRAKLFVDPVEVPPSLRQELEGQVEILPYERFGPELKELAGNGERIWIDPDRTNRWVEDLIQDGQRPLFAPSPVPRAQSIKNTTEREGFRRAHIRDGVAMVRFLRWIEGAVREERVTEQSAADKLETFRRQQDLYQGPSFAPISAYGPHGAIVHYSSAGGSDGRIEAEGLYLIDSGAHYLDGTTDVTRTVALGPVTQEQRESFTRVLKGHILLAGTSFPKGTRGVQLDSLARLPLWEVGMSYGHGSGHGVGSFLSVHEGPQRIAPSGDAPLEAGMFTSIEPSRSETWH